MQHVSSSPSKIPYVGFSPVRLQTGIQPRPSPARRGLSARPTYTRASQTYTWLKLLSQKRVTSQHCCWFYRSRAKAQAVLYSLLSVSNPVQRPLARQRVMLSRRVIAYYGLIRNSRPLPSIYLLLRWVFALRPCMGWYREAPQFAPRVFPLRAAFCTPVDRTVAHGCFFTVRTSLRHLCTGSASTTPHSPVLAWEA